MKKKKNKNKNKKNKNTSVWLDVDPEENELHIPVLYWNSHIISADCYKYSHLDSN